MEMILVIRVFYWRKVPPTNRAWNFSFYHPQRFHVIHLSHLTRIKFPWKNNNLSLEGDLSPKADEYGNGNKSHKERCVTQGKISFFSGLGTRTLQRIVNVTYCHLSLASSDPMLTFVRVEDRSMTRERHPTGICHPLRPTGTRHLSPPAEFSLLFAPLVSRTSLINGSAVFRFSPSFLYLCFPFLLFSFSVWCPSSFFFLIMFSFSHFSLLSQFFFFGTDRPTPYLIEKHSRTIELLNEQLLIRILILITSIQYLGKNLLIQISQHLHHHQSHLHGPPPPPIPPS